MTFDPSYSYAYIHTGMVQLYVHILHKNYSVHNEMVTLT